MTLDSRFIHLIALVSLTLAPKALHTLTGEAGPHESHGKPSVPKEDTCRQRIVEGLSDAQHSGQGQTCQKHQHSLPLLAFHIISTTTDIQYKKKSISLYIYIQYTFKLRHKLLCFSMLFYAFLRFSTLFYAFLCFSMLFYAFLCFVP